MEWEYSTSSRDPSETSVAMMFLHTKKMMSSFKYKYMLIEKNWYQSKIANNRYFRSFFFDFKYWPVNKWIKSLPHQAIPRASQSNMESGRFSGWEMREDKNVSSKYPSLLFTWDVTMLKSVCRWCNRKRQTHTQTAKDILKQRQTLSHRQTHSDTHALPYRHIRHLLNAISS